MTETDAMKVERLLAAGWSAAKVLSGLGHPGYGQAFAKKALVAILAGASAHQAVYGGAR